MAMAHQGMMYTIRKGDNEEPVSHMEIITGRFLLRNALLQAGCDAECVSLYWTENHCLKSSL